MSDSTNAVFLSYASQDADAARRIAEALRAAGVEVWFDQNELTGGDAWDQKIRDQVRGCALFIPIISGTTQARREAYFRLEWKLADERTHLMAKGTPFLLPVTIDETNDRGALVPDSFTRVQWTKLPGGETPDAFCERVLRLLSGNMGSSINPARETTSPPTRREENFWVAVQPFKYRGADDGITALAEGLTEDIVTGLSRFSYLRVIANSSKSRYASETVDVRPAGHELGARYVMEGSLRQAGSRLRVAVQVVDTRSGAHIWAETFDRHFSPEAVFELQDDLVPRIVATVADQHGVLVHSMSEAVRHLDPHSLTPYEALLRVFGYYERITDEEHAEVRNLLERAVEQAPDHADSWSQLSFVYTDEFRNGSNVLPDSLGRAVAAARRAIEAAPASELAYNALANALFFRREIEGFRVAAERAISLNPEHAGCIAYMGVLLAYAGDWERGCAQVRRAHELNPHHAGWYWFADCFDGYRQGDFPAALEAGLKLNLPGYYVAHVVLAATHAQLGQRKLAANALGELLALRPNFAVIAREELGKWFDPELVGNLIDGLRKAGLDVKDSNHP